LSVAGGSRYPEAGLACKHAADAVYNHLVIVGKQ
jgi:hypothetical protein